MGFLGGYLLYLIALFVSYSTPGRILCLRSVASLGRRAVSGGCRMVVRGSSLLTVLIGDGSVRLTLPFGVPMIACRVKARAATRRGLLKCLISRGKSVSFPVLNELRMRNLAHVRIARLVGRGLVRRSLVGSPVIAMRFLGFGISIVKRITHPNAFSVSNSHVALLRTLDVTNSLAVCNHHSHMTIVHRGSNGHHVLCRSLHSSSVFRSPYCCLRRGSVICMRPGGTGANRDHVGSGGSIDI